ncbi:MAG: tRNA (N6-isopentenyl adenosine(37)-C2)-methylthiotransferase MiaB [Candidatus Aerophobetes bacterium]|nr:tRNA (N6-isopentenyl adenosine(37)-C2)-methylthiotransferase MiaB [Candidatus Aerophobetes bacterium]
MLSAYIKTYGCQMNEYDSEVMAGLLQEEGYHLIDNPEEADVILLNSCYVREKVKHKVYSKLGELRKLKEKNPHLILGLCGCLAQREPEEIILRVPFLDFLLGTFSFYRLPEVISSVRENHKMVINLEENSNGLSEDLPRLRKRKFSAFVPVMRGCNNFCSYCNVPYVRGREKSRTPEDILREVEGLSSRGYKEVTLLGQNVNSYGKDLKEKIDFADLLSLINQIEGLKRIRFTTSHPKDLSSKLIRNMGYLDKVCEHLHLPLQSGSDKILGWMGRRYTRSMYKDLVSQVRRVVSEISLTTDIIVGFPGEEEEDFQDTLSLVKEVRFEGAFTFVYSRLKGTKAAELEPQIPEEVKKERLRRLIEVQQRITRENNEDLVGREFNVLVEGLSKKDKRELQGRTRHNKILVFKGKKDLIGKFIRVKITEPGCWALRGDMVSC